MSTARDPEEAVFPPTYRPVNEFYNKYHISRNGDKHFGKVIYSNDTLVKDPHIVVLLIVVGNDREAVTSKA